MSWDFTGSGVNVEDSKSYCLCQYIIMPLCLVWLSCSSGLWKNRLTRCVWSVDDDTNCLIDLRDSSSDWDTSPSMLTRESLPYLNLVAWSMLGVRFSFEQLWWWMTCRGISEPPTLEGLNEQRVVSRRALVSMMRCCNVVLQSLVIFNFRLI